MSRRSKSGIITQAPTKSKPEPVTKPVDNDETPAPAVEPEPPADEATIEQEGPASDQTTDSPASDESPADEPQAAPATAKEFDLGADDPIIARVQQRINDLYPGMASLRVTGHLDIDTHKAIRRVQHKRDLPPNGMVNDALLAALDIAPEE